MFSRHRHVLLRLFQKARELQSDPYRKITLGLEIQRELVQRISDAEKRIQILKSRSKATRVQLSSYRNSKQAAMRLKSVQSACSNRIEVQWQLINIFRDVGDSIAFIYAQRWDLKPFVFKEPAGFLTGKKGLTLERAILRQAYRHGIPAVLNDLTHTLRHGDVTLFLNGQMRLIEAKSGGGDYKRMGRQLSAAQKVMDYLKTDHTPDLYADGQPMSRRAVHAEPIYHTETINKMVRSLKPSGYLHVNPEPGLHYFVIDGDFEKDIDEILNPVLRTKPFVLASNDIKYTKSGYFPFPLIFDSPEALYRYYAGTIFILIVVDITWVEKTAKDRGFTFSITNDPQSPWEFRRAADAYLKLSSHFLGRICAEFLSLGWMIAETVARYDQIGQGIEERDGSFKK